MQEHAKNIGEMVISNNDRREVQEHAKNIGELVISSIGELVISYTQGGERA